MLCVTENEDEDGASGEGVKPALVSFPNPLYSGSHAFTEPFGDGSMNPPSPTEPSEPPNILEQNQQDQ
ncbi:hypothetical protein LDENG_00243330 [Lucifuga dentata]|nr:hypothetical protein LDENG_00243330 [Lucifuga dentata]